MELLYNKGMKLSLCLAVYNEEKNLHYPLDSIIDIVDEVIIVDGGSTDKTIEIAKAYGKKVKIINSDNPAMFHINKQKAIEAATGEWILQLDADEALSPELKQEFRYSILDISKKNPESQNLISNIVAYYLPRKNFFLTRFLAKGGQYPDYTIRLYRNGHVKFPLKSVHENVEIIPNNKYPISNIGFLNNPILHYADPDFSRYLVRWDRYTSLEADQLFNKKKLTISNFTVFDFFFLKPVYTFFSMYFRHLGFLDGFPGFVFALFSSLRFWVIYIKLYTQKDTLTK